MHNPFLVRLMAGLPLALMASPVLAEPGHSSTFSGVTSAQIVDEGKIVKLDDLRFGTMARPAAGATMTITPGGAITATGEIASSMNLFATARGPARFRLQGDNNRLFIPFFPRRMIISNGTSTMAIDQMRDNITGIGRFDRDGRFIYQIGGRLNVGANQEPGQYSGDFEISVLFL